MFYVYILKCSDNSYYTGQTDDIEKRINEHIIGQGCEYTNNRLLVSLVYMECFDRRLDALVMENRIKKWSRRKKEALIKKDWDKLIFLSKRYTRYKKLCKE